MERAADTALRCERATQVDGHPFQVGEGIVVSSAEAARLVASGAWSRQSADNPATGPATGVPRRSRMVSSQMIRRR